MTEIIMELSEEELPDYVNALLDQNRELRGEIIALSEENGRLKDQLFGIPTLTDYVEKYHGGSI